MYGRAGHGEQPFCRGGLPRSAVNPLPVVSPCPALLSKLEGVPSCVVSRVREGAGRGRHILRTESCGWRLLREPCVGQLRDRRSGGRGVSTG